MQPLSYEQEWLVVGSYERLLARKLDLAKAFYAVLFERHPETRAIFPDEMDGQVGKLEKMFAFVVERIHSPDALRGAVRDLARRHVGYGVTGESYMLVEPLLMEALRSLEGADLTREELGAWSALIREIGAEMMQETILKSA